MLDAGIRLRRSRHRHFSGSETTNANERVDRSMVHSRLFSRARPNAADLRLKARLRHLRIYSWTGIYAGLNIGGGIGVNANAQNATFSSTALGTNGLVDRQHQQPGSARMAIAGGQIGFNWQVVAVVRPRRARPIGNGRRRKGRTNNSTPSADLAFFGAGANGFGYALSTQQKLTEIATARARGGFLLRDTLWYVTGGLAWGTIKDSYAFTGTATPVVFPPALQPGPFLPSAGNFSASKFGWTVGAGVETRLGGGWSAKAEYLYVDLGDISRNLPDPDQPGIRRRLQQRRRGIRHHHIPCHRQHRPRRPELQVQLTVRFAPAGP